jgi:hypothetical protein
MLASDFEHAEVHWTNTNVSHHWDHGAQEWMDAQIEKMRSRLHREADKREADRKRQHAEQAAGVPA